MNLSKNLHCVLQIFQIYESICNLNCSLGLILQKYRTVENLLCSLGLMLRNLKNCETFERKSCILRFIFQNYESIEKPKLHFMLDITKIMNLLKI